MTPLTKDMLAVIKHGKHGDYNMHFDSTSSGPFTVSEEQISYGRTKVVFFTRGAYQTPHFTLFVSGQRDGWGLSIGRSIYKGKPGFQIVLRAFAKKSPHLMASSFKPKFQNTPKHREPTFHCYMAHL